MYEFVAARAMDVNDAIYMHLLVGRKPFREELEGSLVNDVDSEEERPRDVRHIEFLGGDDEGAEQEEGDYDVVTGTRYLASSSSSRITNSSRSTKDQKIKTEAEEECGVYGWDTRRKLTSRVANYLAHVMLDPGVSDLTGSFRLYRKTTFQALVNSMQSVGYVFQMEIIVRAKKGGFKVAEVPISFVDRVYGSSKLGASEIIGYLKGLVSLFMRV